MWSRGASSCEGDRALRGKIKLVYAPEHAGPDAVEDRNLLVSEIGSGVREMVLMDNASFYENTDRNMWIIINHLSVSMHMLLFCI